MAKVSDVVKIALAEVGYKEKASNSQLDNPTANAGSNNYTKYARDLRDAGYYNGNKNGFAWCDVFVDWCFYKAFGKTEGQRIECQTGDLGAGCKYSKQYYKNKGRCDRNPKVGDQIFFTSGGTISHTGIVTAVSGEKVTTVEGNSGDAVKKHTYSLSNSYIDSFGHPLYDEDEQKVEPTPEQKTEPAPEQQPTASFKKGDLVRITGTKYYSGKTIPEWVKALNWYIYSISGDRAVIDKDENGKHGIMSPVNIADLAFVAQTVEQPKTTATYTVKSGDCLWNIAKKYLGSGTRYKEIKELNCLKYDTIYVGQVLKIPNR